MSRRFSSLHGRPARVSDRDCQERTLAWVRAELEDRRFPVKALQRMLVTRAYSTCKQLWNGNARFSAGDLATLAQYEGFGADFVLYALGVEGAEIEEDVRARMVRLADEMRALLRGEDDGGGMDRGSAVSGHRSGGGDALGGHHQPRVFREE